MERLVFVSREQVFRECSQAIGSYVQETERLQGEIALHKKQLRKIDPQLVNKPRFYTDDWVLTQLIKTIYYLVQRYFSEQKIAQHRSEITRIQGEVQPRIAVQKNIAVAFNQAFQGDSPVQDAVEVKQHFDTFARLYDDFDFSSETNAFLDREELRSSSLSTIAYRCEPVFYGPSGSGNSYESCLSESEEDIFHDCSSVINEDTVEEKVVPTTGQQAMTVGALFSNERLYEVANHFLPLSRVQSIEMIGEQTYSLTFEKDLIGRVEKLEEGFAEKLKKVLIKRFQEGSDLIVNLKEAYPSVGPFLDKIGVTSLEDVTEKVIYWEGLLGAWGSAGRSYCHLPKKITLHVSESKTEIFEGAFRAGVHITDYHLIGKNLLNTLCQGFLNALLKSLGLVAWNFSTQKPLHSTFSINAFECFPGQEEIFLHVTSEREHPLVFEYDSSWQQPQNFPEGDLENLEKNPWREINQAELNLIGEHFVWRLST